MRNDYSNKEILLQTIDRCDEEELEILKNLMVAVFPDLGKIINKSKE